MKKESLKKCDFNKPILNLLLTKLFKSQIKNSTHLKKKRFYRNISSNKNVSILKKKKRINNIFYVMIQFYY